MVIPKYYRDGLGKEEFGHKLEKPRPAEQDMKLRVIFRRGWKSKGSEERGEREVILGSFQVLT